MQFAGSDFMENIEKIIENQEKINDLMKKYEETTRKMLSCDFDEILGLTEQRTVISKKIDMLNSEILGLCGEKTQEYMAYSNMCDRSILSEDGKVIFDLRLKFKSIAVRIQEMEQEITERISIEKDKLLIKIKENNSGQNAKAAKFFTAGMTNGGNMFFPENKKRI